MPLTWLLSHYQPSSCVVFCNTKRACNDVADHLAAKGFSALALNGDLEQREAGSGAGALRQRQRHHTGRHRRGGPWPRHQGAGRRHQLRADLRPEVHVHRIGRTGRAGQQGLALSLYQPNEAQRVNFIEEYQQAPFPRATWPGSAATSSRSRRRW